VKVTTTAPLALTVAPVICEIRPAPGVWSVTTAVVDVVDVVATVVVDVVGTVVIVVGTVVVVFGTVVVGLGVMAQEDCLPPAQLHSPPRHSATMLFRHCRRALPCSPPQRVFIAGWQRFTVHLFLAASPVEARAASPSAIDRWSRDVI
jgi:hypothetical protein